MSKKLENQDYVELAKAIAFTIATLACLIMAGICIYGIIENLFKK